MRHLVLLRGCPGVGKSTWIKERSLEQYTISPDAIRLMFQTPVMNIDGTESISQKNDRQVWAFVLQVLEQRMARGEFTIIDATHSRSKLVNRYRNLCKQYRYRCTVVDFPNEDVDIVLERNRTRPELMQVPDEVILKVHERLKSDKVPAWAKVISPYEYGNLENILFDFTGKYKKVVVFGDIHGCYEPLSEFFRNNPFSDDTFYIFVGDYLDRGIQNAEVFKFIHALMQNPNVLCLAGNHELHLYDYINGNELKSWAARKSIDQLKEAGVEDSEIKDFYNRLGQLAYFRFHGTEYVVTHGGMPKLPSLYTATQDYICGVGRYEDSDTVDKAFVSNTPSHVYGIHGHRNTFNEPMRNTERTYNLCDKVEFGKFLRILMIEDDGDREVMIKNNVYDEKATVREEQKSKSHSLLKSANNEIITLMNKDRNVVKKELPGGVVSYNFKRSVFRRKRWTASTTLARGLFIDLVEERVVARSYEKFFNWGEREETGSSALKESLVYPVEAYRKHNGYLGVLSVNKGEWFVASKSTTEGDYAGWFRALLEPQLTEQLKQYVQDENVSLIFEVIEVDKDPHIIRYPASKVILLDVIPNTFDEKPSDMATVQAVGEKFGFEHKELDGLFDSWEGLYKFKKLQDDKSRLDPAGEGWVFRDANGFQVKYKTSFYKFWKSMRTIKEALVKRRGDCTEIRQRLHSLDDFTVYNQMIKLPIEQLAKMSIIEVREFVMEELRKEKSRNG